MSVEELTHSSEGNIARNWRKIVTLNHFNFMPIHFKTDRLLRIVRDYDPLTFDHMKQVAYWTQSLEHVLGIDSPDLRLAASLHDVGKIGIPLPVLHPSDHTTVSEEERELRKRHIDHSVAILKKLQFPDLVTRLVLYHETPFSEIQQHAELYQGEIFLPSVLRVSDVLVAALENPGKYGNSTFQEVISEILKQVKDRVIQPEVVIANKNGWLTLGDLFNEHGSQLPKPITRNILV